MKKPQRRYGPSSPVAGYQAAVDAANANRLSPEQIPPLLAAYRDGCDESEQALSKGLQWLIYEAIGADWDRADEWLGSLYIGFADAIRRLAKRGDDPEAAVRAELRRSLRDFYREASPHNPPPASTKSDRLKAGKDPGGLKRVHVIYDRKGFPHDPLTDPETLIKAGYYTEAPGSDGEIEMNAMMESLTPLQRNVVGCMHAGMSERQIAESFGTTRNQVRKLIEIVRRRLDK